MAFVDAALALAVLVNVLLAGIGLECARKLSSRIFLLPILWRMCQRQLPGFTEVLLCFVDIWDQFRCSTLDFEARFATFCDQLGDYLEAVLQRLLDCIERFFAGNQEEEARRLELIPSRRVTTADKKAGLGQLCQHTCAICLEDWKLGDEVRFLTACQHVFHRKCADGWLIQRLECPMCRSPVRLGK